MTEDKHIYFDLDSDILRALIEIDKNTSGQFFDYTTSKNPLIKKYFGYLKAVLDAAKQDLIRLSIGNTIFHENNYSQPRLDFMKKYCYFPSIDIVNCCDKLTKVEKLANLYCQPYTNAQGAQSPAPMQKVYNAAIQKNSPPNDAYAMADAVVWGSNFLTGNGKDLTFNINNPQAGNVRTKGIVEINMQNGYYTMENGSCFVPKPFSIAVVGPIIKNNLNGLSLTQALDSTKIKADRIL